MALVVRAFPVGDRRRIDNFVRELGERQDAAREFYTSLGVLRESWFYQPQPSGRGAMVIDVTEIAEPVAPSAEDYAEASDPFSVWFKAHVYALSGVDPDVTPLGPRSELVHDSSGGALPTNMTLVVRAYPMNDRAGLDTFIAELRERAEDTRGFYDRYGVEEAWFFQNTDDGDIVIAVLATDDAERAARTYQESEDPFDVWFKQRVVEVSGVDPNQTPLGPVSEPIYEFRA
jgi:hypothetical protein